MYKLFKIIVRPEVRMNPVQFVTPKNPPSKASESHLNQIPTFLVFNSYIIFSRFQIIHI